jgi:NAD(P)-dependent dehydrogenase (short-subunit alcohol dehydrogenase family)
MGMEFAGKVAVVSGSASGIGRAILTGFLNEGARGVLADIDDDWGPEVAEQLRSDGKEVTYVKTDVRKTTDVTSLFETAVHKYGGVDVLVDCAGVGVHSEIADMTDEEWDFQVDVQLRGVFLMCRAAARQMIKQGRGGRIINIGSTASAVARFRSGPHSASKAGVILLTKVLSLELARYGITANVVAPGLTDVGPTSKSGGSTPEYQAAFIREVPLGRLAKPEEMADAVLFFASNRASFITGQVLYVDGGYSAGKTGVQGPHTEYFLQPKE